MNILLFVCDTLRADHLGCYAYFRETSPTIDRIASEGVLFEDFYNAGCPTGPGFTSIVTGLHTIHHKFYRFGEPNIRQVDDTIFTMAEILRALDYTTAAFDNLMNQGARAKHFVRGYEFYVNCGPDAFNNARRLKAEQVNQRLLPWVRDHSDELFFLFVHYWDPHVPYNQPDEYRKMFYHKKEEPSDLRPVEAPAGYQYVPGWGKVGEYPNGEQNAPYDRFISPTVSIDLYDGEIAYMDHEIGKVIEALEDASILDETLVVVTSDHGEQLGQHAGYGWEHAGLHDACTHIPLIMRYPKKLPRRVKVNGFCQQIDILPTVLDLLNVQTDVLEVDGNSVLPLLKGEKIRDTIFMEHSSGQRSIRTDEYHLLHDGVFDEQSAGRPRRETELYDVRGDPMEVLNLAKSEKEKTEELEAALEGWVKSNLKQGETDPTTYKDRRQLNNKRGEYRLRIRNLFDSVKILRLSDV